MIETLERSLKQLRLSGLLSTLEVRLQEAASNRLNHTEFLELILQDELLIRKERLIARRTKVASFKGMKTLDEFDFAFNPTIKKKQIFELATCKFIRDATDILFIGPPGVGKSHLIQAIGLNAIKMGFTVLYSSIFTLVREFLKDEAFSGDEKILAKYLKPELLIVDDMGLRELQKRSGEFLFEVIMRRHENRSTVMTSNRPLEDWGKLMSDVPAATAILDRFLQHAEIITITGESYRLKDIALKEKKKEVRLT